MTDAAPFADQTEYEAAVADASHAADSYYNSASLRMSDAEYDTLTARIEATETANPSWAASGGLLTEVAGGTSKGGDIRHTTPMLSLGKAKEESDVRAFIDKVTGAVAIEPKLDGMAVNATYKDGALIQVTTRGDSVTGEDVTAQATGIAGLPARLATKWSGEVRGEVYLSDIDFQTAVANRVAAGKPPFANPRNAVAGSLRNESITYDVPKSFAAYDITGIPPVASHSAAMKEAAALGFGTALALVPVSGTAVTGDHEKALATVRLIQDLRASLGFPIDGAVIKADDLSERARLGAGTRDPRWAVAFKYPADQAQTVLIGVLREVGRTGVVSLTADLEPVSVGGTVVRRATLHNAKFIEALGPGFGPGCEVFVHRAGDVIPRVDAVVETSPAPVTYTVPTTCPQCNEELDTTSSVLWRCLTPECSIGGRIKYAGHRDVWDIDGLDVSTGEALVDAGLVKDIADLFDLTVEQVAGVRIGTTPTGAPRLIGTATATRIVTGIDTARKQPLHRTITALGIRKTGRTMGRRLAASLGSMSALRAANVERLSEVEGIGADKAAYVHAGLMAMGPVIDRLAAAGLPMDAETVEVPVAAAGAPENIVAGKKVVVTGTVPGYGRQEATDLVVRLGGTTAGSVSKNTDLVVVGDGAGSKAEKAAALGVPVMAAADFAALAQAFGF